MYSICKFPGTWCVYESEAMATRPLIPVEIECVEALFSVLLTQSSAILVALQIDIIPQNKLKRLSMFISCYPDRIIIYHQKSKSSQQVTEKQAQQLRALVPALFKDTDEPLITLEVSNLPGAKLLQLPIAASGKREGDPGTKAAGRVGA